MTQSRYQNISCKKELVIVLSDLCNFRCAHCISLSSPDVQAETISDKELLKIANMINNNLEYTGVHFTGGEPTLFFDKMKYIQSLIHRDISYGITTNGHLGKYADKLFDEVNLDYVVLSYDKFHKEFITIEKLQNFIKIVEARSINISIRFLIDDRADFSEIEALHSENVKLEVSRVVYGSNLMNETDNRNYKISLDSGCPSLDLKLRAQSSTQRIIYHKKKGSSVCCGHLSFDKRLKKEKMFSEINSNIEDNWLYKKLNNLTFSNLYQRLKIDIDEVRPKTICEACDFLFEDQSLGVSMEEIASSNKEFFLKYDNITNINKLKYLNGKEIIKEKSGVFIRPLERRKGLESE